jgi:hypothetical protein
LPISFREGIEAGISTDGIETNVRKLYPQISEQEIAHVCEVEAKRHRKLAAQANA